MVGWGSHESSFDGSLHFLSWLYHQQQGPAQRGFSSSEYVSGGDETLCEPLK